jgi:dolichol kinase
MSKDAMQNAGNLEAAEEKESNNGKIIGGVTAAVIGGAIGAILLGPYAIFPAAVVVGVLGVALGAAFD